MNIAKQKKNENIAEYILYIWQLEDMLRASNFDIKILAQYMTKGLSILDQEYKDTLQWYDDLAEMMRIEKIKQSGHLQFIINTVNDLNDFHIQLLTLNNNQSYNSVFQLAYPNIEEMKLKLNVVSSNDVEICLQALYGLLLMRLQKKEITETTTLAMKTFSNFLAVLAQQYHLFEKGDIDIYKNDENFSVN